MSSQINPWTAHRVELVDLSNGSDSAAWINGPGRDIPHNVKYFGKPVLRFIPSTSFIRSKNEIVSPYSYENYYATSKFQNQYILTGDFLGRFHDQHWGKAYWYPHYDPQIFFELPEWDFSKIANQTTRHNGNITGHIFSKHASTNTPRYQRFTFNGQLRQVQNVTEMRSKSPVLDTSKFDVLKLTDDLTFNRATQPLCIKSLEYYENLDASFTQCYIQDNLQLTMPHPVQSIYREKRALDGKPLNIKFGEMLGGDEVLLARISPGYCYDFPETYNKVRYGIVNDYKFMPLIVCRDQRNTTTSTVDADGTGITASEWFVFGSAVKNDLDICYFNFPFYVIPETEAKVEPIFLTEDMLEKEIY